VIGADAVPHTFTPIATLYTCFKEKYGIRLYDLDVKWQITDGIARILSLDPIK
jgi:hypothetical protein